MAGLRFCAYQYQHLPLDALRRRWREAERSGFDVLWNCDTVVEPDRPRPTRGRDDRVRLAWRSG